MCIEFLTHLLLFHKLRVWAVIYNVATEDRSSENSVNLFRICILMFRIEDEVIALGPKVYGRLLAQKNEGEYIAIL